MYYYKVSTKFIKIDDEPAYIVYGHCGLWNQTSSGRSQEINKNQSPSAIINNNNDTVIVVSLVPLGITVYLHAFQTRKSGSMEARNVL